MTYVHYEEAHPAADVPSRSGRDAGAAAARRDGAGAHAAREDRGQPDGAPGVRVSAARRHHGQVDAGDRGQGLRVHADPEAARAVPRVRGRRERPRPPGRRHVGGPLAEPDDLAERRAAEADAGRGCVCRRHGRSDRRAEDRPGDAAPVDRNRHGRSVGPHRIVRPRLRLHLHEHAVVADADHADADGDQPAKGVRADVRPGRQPRRAPGADGERPQHPRRGHTADQGSAAQPRPQGHGDRERLPRKRPRDRAAPPGGRPRAADQPRPAAGAGRHPVQLRRAHQR